jgi:predicted PurR-regulated permease PerM
MLHTFLKYLLKNPILLALFLIATGWFVIQIKDIIVSIFLSYIIMAAVLPMVEFLQRKRFPKILAVLIPYLGITTIIFLLILPIVPFVFDQIASLISKFPRFIDQAASIFHVTIDPRDVQTHINNQIDTIGQNALEFTTKFFGGVFSIITIFVVSFYLLMYNEAFKKFTANLFHANRRTFVLKALDRVNEKLGAWLRGEIVLMFFIGFFSWIGLTLLGLPYALPLALLAGLLEIIPTLGPIISAIPAVIVALTISPTMAIAVVVLYLLIQMLENQILVPKIMERAVGLNPVIVILGVMIGANVMGIAGALLAIPFISFVIVLFNSFKNIDE